MLRQRIHRDGNRTSRRIVSTIPVSARHIHTSQISIQNSSPLHQSTFFILLATFYSRPFQSLRTLNALSRCNISGSSSANASIFVPFLPFRRCEARPKKSTLPPTHIHSCYHERITQISARNRSRICRVQPAMQKKLSRIFVLDTFYYKMVFLFDLCVGYLTVLYNVMQKYTLDIFYTDIFYSLKGLPLS